MITATEASETAKAKYNSIDPVESEINSIDYWIGASSQLGKSDSIWFVPTEMTDEQVDKIIQSFRSRGFEAVKNYGLLRIWKFLW